MNHPQPYNTQVLSTNPLSPNILLILLDSLQMILSAKNWLNQLSVALAIMPLSSFHFPDHHGLWFLCLILCIILHTASLIKLH